MTKITIYQDKQKDAIGFEMKGHAGYGESGSDIVCAAISILACTAYNSIETYTDDTFGYEEREEAAYMKFILTEHAGKEAKLILNSMTLGLSQLAKQYQKYLKLTFKEV